MKNIMEYLEEKGAIPKRVSNEGLVSDDADPVDLNFDDTIDDDQAFIKSEPENEPQAFETLGHEFIQAIRRSSLK